MSQNNSEHEYYFGRNVFARVRNNQLLIRVHLGKRSGLHTSGNFRIVATTRGFVGVPGIDTMTWALNVYESLSVNQTFPRGAQESKPAV
jgi:hypothetical protein